VVSEPEWQPRAEEKFLPEEEPKVEQDLPRPKQECLSLS
jgi:hypothetical protein